MSQGIRDLLSNRKFAIPLIILLAFCFIGLLLIGVVLIWRPGLQPAEEPVAQASFTATLEPTETDSAPAPTETSTPKPSPTLVPVGTVVSGATPAATAEATAEATSASVESATAEPTAITEAEATTAPTSEETAAVEETAEPGTEEEELAQTGVGWGLILASGFGLAMLVVAARRLRLAS